VSIQVQLQDVVGATHWLKLSACPPALRRAGARPAMTRLNKFEETTQVYCLRNDFLYLTGKTMSGPGKGADAEQAQKRVVKQVFNATDWLNSPRFVRVVTSVLGNIDNFPKDKPIFLASVIKII
jgi:hypothetical protein